LYETSGDPTLQICSDIPEEFDDPWDHQALAVDYYAQAYTIWLDNVDEFVEPNQTLEDRYGYCCSFIIIYSHSNRLISSKERTSTDRLGGQIKATGAG
jgi:hypothetical protein